MSARATSTRRFRGRAGNDRGRAAEARAVRLMPDAVAGVAWVSSWRVATADEDARGIDLVVESDVGPLHLQVKASGRHAGRPIYRERGIGVVVVSEYHTDWRVEADLRETLSGLRATRAALAGGRIGPGI